jgi:adenylate cyclase
MLENDSIRDWIIDAALAGSGEPEILTGVCERVAAAGIPLLRVLLANDLLDPTFDARGLVWHRGRAAVEEAFARTSDAAATQSWERSPFFRLVTTRETELRRRLDATYRRGEFPLLDELQAQGATDYVALATWVGEEVSLGEGMSMGDGRGIVASWATDAAGGFSAAQIEVLAALMPILTVTFMLSTSRRNARTLITTYLGSDAAERVLAGNIVRGRADPIRAVVWYSDLVGFTRISDTASSGTVLALLNDYAEAQVEAIEAQGGHVLKFIGDGILAIFPDDDPTRACTRALDAAANLRRAIAALNERRASAGLPVTGPRLALHVGELLYGNLGSPRRLDFTVLGPAVNEAARIVTLGASLDQTIIVSSAFAESAGAARARLVGLGRYAMKGVARPQELYALDLD